jgi:hypothetical protein
MRLLIERFVLSAKSNFFALRLAFLFGALTYVAYLGAWINWQQSIPRVPLYVFFVGAYPWSMAWHNWQHDLIGAFSWPIRHTISIAVVACGFGFNCAFILAIVRFIRPQTHNPAVDPAPFSRWTLRDKAAQRRSPLR